MALLTSSQTMAYPPLYVLEVKNNYTYRYGENQPQYWLLTGSTSLLTLLYLERVAEGLREAPNGSSDSQSSVVVRIASYQVSQSRSQRRSPYSSLDGHKQDGPPEGDSRCSRLNQRLAEDVED